VPEQFARRALSNEWFERAVRFGHFAKGAVFGAIGIIALRLTAGDRRDEPDVAGAMEFAADQPLDVLFLLTLALGLLSYAAWRFAYGIADLDDAGGGVRGWSRRAVILATGVTYLGFAIYAIGLLVGMRRTETGIEDETATILEWPFGQWIVAAVAAGVVAAGLHELFVAFTARFREEFGRVRFGPVMRVIATAIGWWGHAARGAIYVAAGWFGLRAAITYDPDEAKSFADTLWEIGTGPYGDFVLGFIAAGLISFGLYATLLAIRRHIPDAEEDAPHERMP
jgi:hypothetical protein